MVSQSLTLRQKLHEFALSRRRHIGRLSAVRALWVALAGALVLVYADVLVILPDDVRAALTAGYAAVLVAVAFFTYRAQVRAVSEERHVARLVEQGSPGLHNDLISAVDFEDALKREVRPELSRELMSHEIGLASERVAGIAHVDTLRPPSLRREVRLLVGILALAVLVGLLFAGVFAAVLPRFVDPWGDHPPYSPTRLSVEPAGATVEYGANQVIRVAAAGRKPEEMKLVLEDRTGARVATLPMLDAGDGTYFQTVENVRTDLLYHAEIHRGRSKRYTLTLSKTPRIDSVAVTYAYPEYTHLPSKTRLLPNTDATLAAYEGTKVRLEMASNRPLKGGPVEVGGKALSLRPGADENTVQVDFPVESPGEITARLLDVEGFQSSDVFRGKLEVTPDKRPEVTVVSPGKSSFAIPNAKVPIVIEARDDLGIQDVALVRSLNGLDDDRKELYRGHGDQIFTSLTEVLDLGDLGVRPGDVIDYYATATDTLPEAPQTASTPSFQIAIVSFEDYREFMQKKMTAEDLKNQYDQYLEQLEALAKAQEDLARQTRELEQKLAEKGALSDAERAQLDQARKDQAALAKQAGELAKALNQEAESPAIFDIEEDYKRALKNFAERLASAQESMEAGKSAMQDAQDAKEGESGRQSLQTAQQHQQDALEQLGQTSKQFQEQIQEANQDLERVYKLLNDVERFKQLYAAQQMVERQTRTLKDVQTPTLDQQIRLKELGENQNEVRKALEQLRDDLKSHAADVKDDYPKVAEDAEGIAGQIDSLKIPGLMKGATDNLSASKAPEGHAGARDALDAMESMVAFCQSMGQAGSQCELRLKIAMALNPGNTLRQLSKSLGMGAGAFGQGFGEGGQGSGSGSGSTPFDLYGPESFKPNADRESPASTRRAHDAQAQPVPPEALAGSFEELGTTKNESLQVESSGGEHVVEEYRPLIEAYFRGLAEEKS